VLHFQPRVAGQFKVLARMWSMLVNTLKRRQDNPKENKIMLITIATVLIVLWILGLVTSSAIGGFVHILLVMAIIIVLIRVIQGRRVL
jgi:hypothetical protein